MKLILISLNAVFGNQFFNVAISSLLMYFRLEYRKQNREQVFK